MRQSKKHFDMQHKKPKQVKKDEKPKYKLDEPIRSNVNEQNWQYEARKLKERNRDQMR